MTAASERKAQRRELVSIAMGLHAESPVTVPAGLLLELVREADRASDAKAAMTAYEAHVLDTMSPPAHDIPDPSPPLPRPRVYLMCHGCRQLFVDALIDIRGCCPACATSGVRA